MLMDSFDCGWNVGSEKVTVSAPRGNKKHCSLRGVE